MLNHLILFVIVFNYYGNCNDQSYSCYPNEMNSESLGRLNGRWYGVFGTNNIENKVYNLFRNTTSMLKCISIYYKYLEDNVWKVYISSIDKDTNIVTVVVGGALESSFNSNDITLFTIGQAEMKSSVFPPKSPCFINEKVVGNLNFNNYKINILNFEENQKRFMIQKIENNEESLTIVLTRTPTPGKMSIWKAILDTLYSLKIDPHKELMFLNHTECVYPSLAQIDEITFC